MKKISSSRPGSTRPVPQRTCVACRRIKAKRELVRLVRTRGGNIEIDVAGKKEGRGAYICPELECWERALKGKQLEHTLRSNLTQDNREQLIRSGKDLLKELASG
ncbi:MAG: YlxR family protein [Dehalococcoidales bacterium]|nr:YlxR family protein [Dehalococcoidales bacterium]